MDIKENNDLPYKLTTKLATTLQGGIFLGKNSNNKINKKYVIKVANKFLVSKGITIGGVKVYENFLKERDLTMKLSKINNLPKSIIKGISCWDDNKNWYFTMEYCEIGLFQFIQTCFSKDLKNILDKSETKEQRLLKRTSPWIMKIHRVFVQILNGLHFLHNFGISHMDMSLENCMMYDINNEIVKIIDFGVALLFDIKKGTHIQNKRIGKIQYMSPEVCNICM